MAQYAVLRIDKKHTIQEVAALGRHNERTRPTPNPTPRAWGRICAWPGPAIGAPTIRANAVIAIEHVMTASREWYARRGRQRPGVGALRRGNPRVER